jgi:transcriptional regulator with XRE-family HTH domain
VKDKKYLKQLGARIRELRLQKGLSQVDLGIRMDNYGEEIGRIERGQLNVTICALKKIAEGLDISLPDMLGF